MKCPFCSYEESKVIDSRLVADSSQIRRRRECNKCNERWTTFELAELLMPKIVKQDKSRVPFDEIKLKEGISRSLEKRPVSEEDFETLIEQIKRDIRGFGEREVSSRVIGETVMKHLRKIDEVAFVRFASVYRNFREEKDFIQFVDKIDVFKKK